MTSAGDSIRLTTIECEAGTRFLWSDVRAVTVVTRPSEHDDILALRFALADGRVVELSEECPGFTQLVQFLPEVLPGFPDHNEWLYEASEGGPESETLLYEAGGAR